MNKKILILGANVNQIPLIQRAKRFGLYTVVCDFRMNVPGVEFADKFYHTDCLDVNRMVEIGREEKVHGIITNSEPLFLAMSKIATKLGLRSLTEETTNLFKNKYLMREFCRKNGMLSPRYRLCLNINEALDFYTTIQKKCIIKPLDNSASRGVFSINSRDDLLKYFEESIGNSTLENKGVIIEEYISGTEFTIDGIKTNSGHKSLVVSKKKHYDYNENVAYQLYFSDTDKQFNYNELRETNDFLVNQTNMPFGLTHAEYKYYNGQFYLIEIQARGGGNFIATDIVPYMSGIDTYDLNILWAIGEDVDIQIDYNCLPNHYAVLHFFDTPKEEGRVAKIEGEDLLVNETMKYELLFKTGDTIQRATNDSARVGYYIACSESEEYLLQLMKKIDETFKIILE